MMAWMICANLSFHVFGTEFGAELIKRPFWIMTSFMLMFFGIQPSTWDACGNTDTHVA